MITPSADQSAFMRKDSRVAVLSVTEPFWVHMELALSDLVTLRRISSREDLLTCVHDNDHFDLLFVPHWRWILPTDVLSRWRCVGFHTSPLPMGKGGSPIQNQIVRGIYSSEVCAFRMTDNIDGGDIYLRRPISLEHGTIADIIENVAAVSAEMARDILINDPVPIPQRGQESFYSRIVGSDNQLPLDSLTAREIFDRIRMVDGFDYPRAYLVEGAWILEFSKAQMKGSQVEATVRFISNQDRKGNV